jgi:hypothetical protein
VKHRRQERAGADQVSGGDEDSIFWVRGLLAELPDQRRHGLGATGRHHHLFALVAGIGDPDAGRRPEVAVEIVDGENSDIDRRGGSGRSGNGCGDLRCALRDRARGQARRRRQHHGDQHLTERISHDAIIENPYNDFTNSVQALLREKNALNAATASAERIRSPNRWLS